MWLLLWWLPPFWEAKIHGIFFRCEWAREEEFHGCGAVVLFQEFEMSADAVDTDILEKLADKLFCLLVHLSPYEILNP